MCVRVCVGGGGGGGFTMEKLRKVELNLRKDIVTVETQHAEYLQVRMYILENFSKLWKES